MPISTFSQLIQSFIFIAKFNIEFSAILFIIIIIIIIIVYLRHKVHRNYNKTAQRTDWKHTEIYRKKHIKHVGYFWMAGNVYLCSAASLSICDNTFDILVTGHWSEKSTIMTCVTVVISGDWSDHVLVGLVRLGLGLGLRSGLG